MRVTTAFNRMLDLQGASVRSVTFADEGVVVGVAPTTRRHRCPCGAVAPRYDRSRRRWRHVDAAGSKLWLEYNIARVSCPTCARVRTEQVPWARPSARFTSDLEDVIAWLCQRTDKTTVTRLLRVSWAAVQDVVERVVGDHLIDARLDGVLRLGVDEISYKRGHQYLTIVADQDTGKVLHVAQGRRQAALQEFFDELGPQRCAQVTAISMDMAPLWRAPCEQSIPQAAICFDPFHIVRLANIALDDVYKISSREYGTGTGDKAWRRTRFALRAGAEKLRPEQQASVRRLRRTRYALWRAWELKEGLRDLYRSTDPDQARGHLTRWCRSAERSKLRPFHNLARQLRRHFDGIVNAVEHGLSNSRLEGINAKIRLINKRGYGHRNVDHLTAMIHLCLGGITLQLPTET